MRLRQTLRFATRMATSRVRGVPELLLATLFVTHRCNLRCTYCNSPFLNTPELRPEQWLTVVDELAELGCRRVTILGGEPLVRPDVGAIIDRVRDRGMSCVLTSNGLLVPRQIDRLRRLNTLVLSLDAPGPANDAVRGAGVFAAVRDAIDAARGADIQVKLNAVVSAKTAPHIDAMLAFVAQHDIAISFSILRSEMPQKWRDAVTIKAPDDEIRQTAERLAALSRTNRRILFSPVAYAYAAAWGDYSRDRYEADELPPSDPRRRAGPRCHAGRYYLAINPDGAVSPCSLTTNQLTGGSVAALGVKQAWQTVHAHPCVACFSPCTVEMNHLFSLQPRVLWRFVTTHVPRFE